MKEVVVSIAGSFLRDGERREAWGANLSRALWYSSRGCSGSARDGRMKVEEFLRYVDQNQPGLFDEGRDGWARRAWEIKLPNGVRLAFVPRAFTDCS